jgi:hypothetical protein
MMQSSGEIRRENAGVYPVLLVIAREGGRSSTLRPIGSCTDVSGILDRPVEPDDDSGMSGCLKIESGNIRPSSRTSVAQSRDP